MIRFFLLGLCSLFLLTACEETSSIGSGLLTGEELSLGYTEELKVSANVQPSDRLITFIQSGNTTSNFSTFSLGQLDDPYFGKKTSDVFFQIVQNPILTPDFSNGVIDSIVMILTYDTLGSYGNPMANHEISVFPLLTDPSLNDTIFSDQNLSFENEPIGRLQFIPRPKDSLTIIAHNSGDTVKIGPQIRIRMDGSWAEEFFKEPNAHESDEELIKYLPGFYLSSKSTESSLFGINLSNVANSENGSNRIAVYYTTSDTIKNLYTFRINEVRGQLHNVDRAGYPVEKALTQGSDVDSLLFIQGQSGTEVHLSFDDLSFLEDKIVNHAVLKITLAANLPGDNKAYYKGINQMLAFEVDADGDKSSIKDASDLERLSANYALGFGGKVVEEDGKKVLTINVTKKLKSILSGQTSNKIILTPQLRSQIPNREIYSGKKTGADGIKLEVTYTLK